MNNARLPRLVSQALHFDGLTMGTPHGAVRPPRTVRHRRYNKTKSGFITASSNYRTLGSNFRVLSFSLLSKTSTLPKDFKSNSTPSLTASQAVVVFNSTLGAHLQNLAQSVYGDTGEVKTEAVKCQAKDSNGKTTTKVRAVL